MKRRRATEDRNPAVRLRPRRCWVSVRPALPLPPAEFVRGATEGMLPREATFVKRLCGHPLLTVDN